MSMGSSGEIFWNLQAQNARFYAFYCENVWKCKSKTHGVKIYQGVLNSPKPPRQHPGLIWAISHGEKVRNKKWHNYFYSTSEVIWQLPNGATPCYESDASTWKTDPWSQPGNDSYQALYVRAAPPSSDHRSSVSRPAPVSYWRWVDWARISPDALRTLRPVRTDVPVPEDPTPSLFHPRDS